MARSSVAAALIALAFATTPARAVDLCEGCWEIGVRASLKSPSGGTGLDASAGFGASAGFRFRPYWSVDFAFDVYPASIPDGPDETLTFLTSSFVYTFRAGRDQRTRPHAFFALGMIYDTVSADRTDVPSPSGSMEAKTESSDDNGICLGFGAGARTSLGQRTFLRYEARFLQWSTFGISQSSWDLVAGVTFRLGR